MGSGRRKGKRKALSLLNVRTGPEGGLGLLVHLPHVLVGDGEHGEAVVVGPEEGLLDTERGGKKRDEN
jgi:hypothetical protein